MPWNKMADQDRQEIRRRWSFSFTASVLCHLLVAILLTWKLAEQPLPKPKLPETMDVVMLKPEVKPSKTPPKKADAISNKTVRGGNRTAQDRLTRAARSPVIMTKPLPRPSAPRLPAPPPIPPEPKRQMQNLARRKPKPKSKQRQPVLAQRGPEPKPESKPRPPKRKRQVQKKPPSLPRLKNLMPSSTMLAQRSKIFDRERRMKKLMSREAEVPINTRDVRFAPYAQSLVHALEEQWRPGQANYITYPEQARQVFMKITIEGNGDLGKLVIVKPSPIPGLNDSAIRAVHDASPFKPLPSSWGLDRITFNLVFEVIEDRFVFRAQ